MKYDLRCRRDVSNGTHVVCICPQGEGRNTDEVPFGATCRGCVEGEVCAACRLNVCDKDTERTLWHTSIKMEIGICAQKQSHRLSHTTSHTFFY